MGCFVVARFVLTSASRSPSAIAELLVDLTVSPSISRLNFETERVIFANGMFCNDCVTKLARFFATLNPFHTYARMLWIEADVLSAAIRDGSVLYAYCIHTMFADFRPDPPSSAAQF